MITRWAYFAVSNNYLGRYCEDRRGLRAYCNLGGLDHIVLYLSDFYPIILQCETHGGFRYRLEILCDQAAERFWAVCWQGPFKSLIQASYCD